MQSGKNLDISEQNLLCRLNAVRLFIVLLITVGYASTMPQGPSTAEIFNVYGYDPSWFGIQLLFFISGLLAMRSVQKGRVGLAYLRSRFRRNIPLLAIITLGTFIILLPLYGTFEGSLSSLCVALAKYMALTISCIDPGIPFPGLFDAAHYTSLVQGSLWTLRYGVILHIGVSLAGRLGVLSYDKLIVAATVMTMGLYLGLAHYTAVKGIKGLDVPLTGLRLAYAFLIGMSAWMFRARLTAFGPKLWWLPLIFIAVASVNFMLDWSSIIEGSLTLAWLSLCYIALFLPYSNIGRIDKCPNLTLLILAINWPICQVLLQLRDEWTILPFIGAAVISTLLLSLCLHAIWRFIQKSASPKPVK